MGNITGRTSVPSGDISIEELQKHNTKDDAWMVLFGEVLDVTEFIPIHPGGADTIDMYLGKDATEEWVEIHTPETLEKNLQHITKIGKMEARRGLMSWLYDRLTAPRDPSLPTITINGAPQQTVQDDDDWPQGTQFNDEFEEELQKMDGKFTLESLARWNGQELPMLISICGMVIDVSPSENFIPTHGYGKLWGGKDCTWAMATVSLKADDANRFDFKVEELEELQFKSLAGWYKHFTATYTTVGQLDEMKDWDFSTVIAAAKEMMSRSRAGTMSPSSRSRAETIRSRATSTASNLSPAFS